MHAKPPQDGTTRAVLWLEAIKTRCTGGPVAEEVMTQRTKAPFRADHVGSILRTTPVKDARAKREKGEITAAQLKAKRRIAILIAFIVAAVLTPPDPLSQISLALPTIALYELSIYAVKLAEKRHAASPASAKPAAKPAGKPA